MAHKTNPIGAEQLAGMARMARGYANMLQPLDLWLERDISHSSVERVAVPDLWHIVLHSIKVATELLEAFEIDEFAANNEIRKAGIGPLVASLTTNGVMNGKSIEDARQAALDMAKTPHPRIAQPDDAFFAMRNYPRSSAR
jgi:adenylosuccinate lyase